MNEIVHIRGKCLLTNKVFTVRKRSLRRLCFYNCLSVILFTGGVPGQVSPKAGIPPWGGTPRAGTSWPDTPPGQVHPQDQEHPPDQVHPLDQVHPPGRYTPRNRYIPPQTPPPPADGYCCGWYASYWNAFLLYIICPAPASFSLLIESVFLGGKVTSLIRNAYQVII